MAMLVYQRVSPHISTTLTGDGPIAPGALVEKHESLEMAFGALDSAAEGALTRESLAMGIEAQRGETTLFATLFYGSIYIYMIYGKWSFGGTRDETDKLNRGRFQGGDHTHIYIYI